MHKTITCTDLDNGEHIMFKKGKVKSLTGTTRYASVHNHDVMTHAWISVGVHSTCTCTYTYVLHARARQYVY